MDVIVTLESYFLKLRVDEDLVDHLDPDYPFEIDLGGQG
jgi:hypothetical protein